MSECWHGITKISLAAYTNGYRVTIYALCEAFDYVIPREREEAGTTADTLDQAVEIECRDAQDAIGAALKRYQKRVVRP